LVRETNFNVGFGAKLIVVAHDEMANPTMNNVKQPRPLLVPQRTLFNGILCSPRLRVIAVVFLGMTVAHQRASASDDTSKPGATPTPSETVTASPTASPSPTASVTATTPEPTAVLTPNPIDPKLVGHWEISDSRVGASEDVTWEIQANGRYRLVANSEHKTGILSTSDGKIRLNVEFTGVVELDYKIDDNNLTTTAPDGTAIDWRLVKSEAKPHKVVIVHRHHTPPPRHYPGHDLFNKVKRFFGFGE
jgi:hypothetical protein